MTPIELKMMAEFVRRNMTLEEHKELLDFLADDYNQRIGAKEDHCVRCRKVKPLGPKNLCATCEYAMSQST